MCRYVLCTPALSLVKNKSKGKEACSVLPTYSELAANSK